MSENTDEQLGPENCSKKTLRKLQADVCSKLKCSVCPGHRFTSLKMYDEHLKSKKHLRKKFRRDTSSVWHCMACNITLPNNDEWVKHLAGQRHDNALQALSLQRNPSSKLISPKEIAMLDTFVMEEDEEDI